MSQKKITIPPPTPENRSQVEAIVAEPISFKEYLLLASDLPQLFFRHGGDLTFAPGVQEEYDKIRGEYDAFRKIVLGYDIRSAELTLFLYRVFLGGTYYYSLDQGKFLFVPIHETDMGLLDLTFSEVLNGVDFMGFTEHDEKKDTENEYFVHVTTWQLYLCNPSYYTTKVRFRKATYRNVEDTLSAIYNIRTFMYCLDPSPLSEDEFRKAMSDAGLI